METLIPLTVAVPLVVAALLMAVASVIPRRIADAVAILTAVAMAVIGCLLTLRAVDSVLVYWFGGWLPRAGKAIGIAFVVDPFSGALVAFTGILMTAALVFSWRYFATIGTLFHSIMLVFLAALNGFSLSGDLFTLFVFFELMGVAGYALTGYKIEESSLEGALNFGVTNSIGGFALLLGIGLVYGSTGALNMAQIGNTLLARPVDGLIVAGFLLIVSGLLIKGTIVPFHFWLDDAHAVAPTPVCVMFSGIMVEVALYAVARIYWAVFSGPMGPHSAGVREVLMAGGVVTSVLGALMCFAQRHIKRMLAFSTISHSGTILVGIAAFNTIGLAGAGFYLLAHGFLKGALFIGAGILIHRFSSVDELSLRGRGRKMPWAGAVFTIAGIGLTAVPPFGLLFGKAWIDDSSAKTGNGWVIPLLILSSALTAAAVLRVSGRVFLGLGAAPGQEARGAGGGEEPETTSEHYRTPTVMLAAAIILIVMSIVLPYIPDIRREAHLGALVFMNREAYSSAVIRGVQIRPPTTPAFPEAMTKGMIYGIITLVAAVVVALGDLYRRRLPPVLLKAGGSILLPIGNAIRGVHNGHIGDYITWLVVGLAIYGVLFTAVTRLP